MKQVDLIIPCYNKVEYTKECIDSLMRYTEASQYCVFPVDNGSRDETRSYLIQLDSLGINAIPVLKDENLGWIKAINFVLNRPECNAEFVCFANNDILFPKGWLEGMLKYFDDPNVGAVGPTSNYVLGLQGIQHNIAGVAAEETKYLIGFCLIIRRSILDKIGFLDERFGMGGSEDIDLSIRIRGRGYKLMIARDVYIHHYGSMSFKSYIAKQGIEYTQYWEQKDALLREKWGPEIVDNTMRQEVRLKIGICTPFRTEMIYHGYHKSFVMLDKVSDWTWVDQERAHVEVVRNNLAKYALDDGCTHVLFIDDDHEFPSDLLRVFLGYNLDVVGALCFQRLPEHLPCTFRFNEDQTGLSCVELIDVGLQPVDAIGFAFVLIKRKVLEECEWPWFRWGDKSLGVSVDKGGIGEDLSFCVRARRKGFGVYVDTDREAIHIGGHRKVGKEYYKRYKKQTGLEQRIVNDQIKCEVQL